MTGSMDKGARQTVLFCGGTGAVQLSDDPVAGFETFLWQWGPRGTGWYCLVLDTQWEIGPGQLDIIGRRLIRVRPFNGSSGKYVKVNFAAGKMDCFAIPKPMEVGDWEMETVQ